MYTRAELEEAAARMMGAGLPRPSVVESIQTDDHGQPRVVIALVWSEALTTQQVNQAFALMPPFKLEV